SIDSAAFEHSIELPDEIVKAQRWIKLHVRPDVTAERVRHGTASLRELGQRGFHPFPTALHAGNDDERCTISLIEHGHSVPQRLSRFQGVRDAFLRFAFAAEAQE